MCFRSLVTLHLGTHPKTPRRHLNTRALTPVPGRRRSPAHAPVSGGWINTSRRQFLGTAHVRLLHEETPTNRRRSFKMMPGAAPRVSGAPTPEGAPGGGPRGETGWGDTPEVVPLFSPPRFFKKPRGSYESAPGGGRTGPGRIAPPHCLTSPGAKGSKTQDASTAIAPFNRRPGGR